MTRRTGRLAILSLLVLLAVLAAAGAWLLWPRTTVHVPTTAALANPSLRPLDKQLDLMGRGFTVAEVERVKRTPAGELWFAPDGPAISVTDTLLEAGQAAFWAEAFGTALPLSDWIGWFQGPLTWADVTAAVAALEGRPTGNLEVVLSGEARLGDRILPAGTRVATGLDVPAGAALPLGLVARRALGNTTVGVGCALCHAAVRPEDGRVVQGAPNTDLDFGLLLALGPQSRALVAFTGLNELRDGPATQTPEAAGLEAAVDATLDSWPAGSLDMVPDLVDAPANIPALFRGPGGPYGWTGFAAAGPFAGLPGIVAAHAPLFDPSVLEPSARHRLGLPSERYTALLPPRPTPPESRAPYLTTQLRLRGGARPSLLSTDGVWQGQPGERAGATVYALSAWVERLMPPPGPEATPEALALGRDIFARAGCAACHRPGDAPRDREARQVVPATETGSDPRLAGGLTAAWGARTTPAQFYAPDTATPPPQLPKLHEVRDSDAVLAPEQLALAWGLEGGGYSVPSLAGLALSAPYLHDGAVADLEALLDRDRRAGTGSGAAAHPFWVDAPAGFTAAEREAMVAWLLANAPDRPAAP